MFVSYQQNYYTGVGEEGFTREVHVTRHEWGVFFFIYAVLLFLDNWDMFLTEEVRAERCM